MAYTADLTRFSRSAAGTASLHAATHANKSDLLPRIYDAIMRSRQRRADQDIARGLLRPDGRLTDSIEREMMQRLFAENWSVRG
jgi:hypothetical protein